MVTRLNPYLSFDKNAKEAMEFYQSVFGGELTSSTFGEGGMPVEDDEKDLIMHSQLVSANDLVLMGADTPSHMERTKGNDITVSLSGEDETELRGYWDKLTDGGSVTMPLEKAPWGDSFGMCSDKFGTDWMVNISGAG